MLRPFPLSLATLDAIKAERDKLFPWDKADSAGVVVSGAVVGYDDLLEHYRLLVKERARIVDWLRDHADQDRFALADYPLLAAADAIEHREDERNGPPP